MTCSGELVANMLIQYNKTEQQDFNGNYLQAGKRNDKDNVKKRNSDLYQRSFPLSF